MEKKIARITRWLERCAKACSACSWQSALIDMECAKAELENVRGELWEKAESGAESSRSVRKAGRLVFASVLGLSLILSSAVPLAVQQMTGRSASVPGPALEWVSSDEKALLAALRRSLSESNLARISEKDKEAEPDEGIVAFEEPQPVRGRNQRYSALSSALPGTRAKKTSNSGEEFDTIINLVRIGQKALRDREATIRFEAAK